MHELDAGGGARAAGIDRRRFLSWLLAAGAGIAAGPAIARAAVRDPSPETARAWRAMGTLIEVRVPDLPPPDAVEAIARVRERVEALEEAMTLYRPGAPLVRFNAAPEGAWFPAPRSLVEAVHAALAGHRETEGRFDPTVAPAMRAWGLYALDGELGDLRLLGRWRRRPGPEAVEIDLPNRRIRRLDRRVEIDLGALGKGIAADAALRELRRAGSRAALVNLGGSIGVLGPPPGDPRGWPVGFAVPWRPGEVFGTCRLDSGHLAVSGSTERRHCTRLGWKHHLLDPRSGESTPGEITVLARAATGAGADLASTGRFVGLSRGEDPGDVFCYAMREETGGVILGGAGLGSLETGRPVRPTCSTG